MKHFASRTLIALAAVAFIGVAASASAHLLPPVNNTLAVKALFGFGEDKPAQPQVAQQYHVHDDDSFAKNTKVFSMMPYDKADLEFEFSLPNDWTSEEMITGQLQPGVMTVMGDVARFKSQMIGILQAKAAVEVLKIEHEMSAKHWLRQHMLASGYGLEGEVAEQGPRSASASYIIVRDSQTWYGYMGLRMSGNFAEIARFEVPLKLKNYLGYLQKKSVDSFRLLYPKEDAIEDQKVFTVVDCLKFNYPQSWTIASPDFKDMNRLSVTVQNLKPPKVVQGFIRFSCIRRGKSTDFMTEIEGLRKYLTENAGMALDIKKMLSSEKSEAYDRFLFSRYEVYDVQSKRNKAAATQELHAVLLGDKEWYVLIFLFTPKEASDLYTWARNLQTYKVIVKSIR
ncbi:MAG: hypothetical protein ACAH80_00435 [Alphaproteobacteria bacterium]